MNDKVMRKQLKSIGTLSLYYTMGIKYAIIFIFSLTLYFPIAFDCWSHLYNHLCRQVHFLLLNGCYCHSYFFSLRSPPVDLTVFVSCAACADRLQVPNHSVNVTVHDEI